MYTSQLKTKSLQLLAGIAITLGLGQTALAQNENIEVTPLQKVTQQELAAIYVLSEVCPALIQDKDQTKFNQGYAKLAKEYMPAEKIRLQLYKP